MFDHHRIYFEQEYKSRQNELLREAEMIRLVNQARESHAPQSQLYRKVLSSMGHRLVSWGKRLERLDQDSTVALALGKPDCAN